MADIFLSYNEKDRSAVSRLAEMLQSVGWSVWWDRRIPAGSTWRSVLERELQGMRCMIVLWSSNSVHSEWVCEEASEARQLGRLVPVSIDRSRPPAGFREIQAADLVDWDGSRNFVGLQRLLEDIERLIGKPGAAPPEASKPEPRVEPDGGAGPGIRTKDNGADVVVVEPSSRRFAVPASPARRMLPWGAAALIAVIAAVVFFERSRPDFADTAKRPDQPQAVVTAPAPSIAGAEEGKTAAAPSQTTRPPDAAATSPAVTATLQPSRVTKAPSPSADASTRNVKAPAPVNPRCAALTERLALGETLSGPSQLVFLQECRQ